MYSMDFDEKPKLKNSEVVKILLKRLKSKSSSLYGLRDIQNGMALLTDTSLQRRKNYLGYNLKMLQPKQTLLYTGQCLLKEEEDPECPITLEDAVECENLKEMIEKSSMPTVCIYPDTTYRCFLNQEEKILEHATEIYLRFRRRILPDIIHCRISDIEEKLKKQFTFSEETRTLLKGQIRRIYGGRILKEEQTHPSQEAILEYGIQTLVIPSVFGLQDKHIAVFAEPDEICSVIAAENVKKKIEDKREIGLIGQFPLPSIAFETDGELRMYSANRESRIHLNESDLEIRTKLEKYPEFSLLTLYLSPLTTDMQFDEIGKSEDRNIGIDLLMEQIKKFKSYVGG